MCRLILESDGIYLGRRPAMKIYNNTNITYSAIEQNSRKNTKQNIPADLEKKMTQYTDTLSISKTGQESFRHLSSVSSMDYQNRFEKEVTDIFVKEDTESVKTDSFEHHVNRMAEAYNKMKNSIEEKYAAQDYEQEYYVTESGKIEELTKEKELDMLNQAYENHSNFMATSTEIWSELQDFTPSVVYHKGSEQTANEQNIGENQENTARSKENGVIQNSAYQAFLSAIQSDNQKLSQQYSGDWKDLRLNLNVSDGDRKMLNGIWDYYANIYTNAYTGNIWKNNAKETTEKQVVEQTEDVKTGTTRKTAADELSYLSKKMTIIVLYQQIIVRG